MIVILSYDIVEYLFLLFLLENLKEISKDYSLYFGFPIDQFIWTDYLCSDMMYFLTLSMELNITVFT